LEVIWLVKSVHKVKCAVLPSSGNGAHFGFKRHQLFLQVLWIENTLKILSSGHKNSGLNYTQAQLYPAKEGEKFSLPG